MSTIPVSATAMNTPALPPPSILQAPTGRGLPFGRLVQVELRKQVDTRGGRALLATIALITVLAVAGVLWFSRHDGASFTALVAATAVPQNMLIPLLGIITACNEWSQRTALITFTHEPRRARVVGAKCAAAIIWATAFLLLAWCLAAAAHVLSMSLAGHPAHMDVTARQALAGWIDQMVMVLMGLGFGFLLLITPLAIASYFVVPALVTGVVAAVPALRNCADWISSTSVPLVHPAEEPLPSRSWAMFATSILLWMVVPLVVGTLRVMRREVK